MKIVIKVGTQAILAEDGTVLENNIAALVEQIATLHKQNHQVVLISSGAVSSGRRVVREQLNRKYGSTTGEKQLLASLTIWIIQRTGLRHWCRGCSFHSGRGIKTRPHIIANGI